MCYVERPTTLAHKFLLQSSGAGAAGRALRAIPKLPDIDLKFVDGAAQRIAVHAQFAGGAALVALVFLKHGEDESFFEFAHTLRIKDVAPVHLQNQCF